MNFDKPFCALGIDDARALDVEDYLVQLKYDGWRVAAHWDGEIITCRTSSGRPLHLPEITLEEHLKQRPIAPAVFDGELMGRRSGHYGIILFSVLEIKGRWMGSCTEWRRWRALEGMVSEDFLAESGELETMWALAHEAEGAEGIVLKRKESTLCGAKNPGWYKVLV